MAAIKSIQASGIKVQKPSKYWIDINNQRNALNEIATKLNINKTEDWYKITCSQLRNNGGAYILKVYGSSMIKMLQSVYPHIKWIPWKFAAVGPNFWKKEQNVKNFMSWVSTELGIHHMEDWYGISTKQFSRYGKGLLQHYNSSLYKLLCTIYPSYDWQPWKFTGKTPNRYWSEPENVLRYLKWLEIQFGVNQLSDWAYVSAVDVARLYGGARVLALYGGFRQLLSHFYPHFNWAAAEAQVKRGNSKAQLHLTKIIQKIFSTQQIISNYRHPHLESMELDVFLPQLNLAFEYQGEQHYVDHYIFGDQQELHERDNKKAALCNQLNIKLVQVPFWWDKSETSLRATTQKIIPELSVASHDLEKYCIPKLPPQRFLNMKKLSKLHDMPAQ